MEPNYLASNTRKERDQSHSLGRGGEARYEGKARKGDPVPISLLNQPNQGRGSDSLLVGGFQLRLKQEKLVHYFTKKLSSQTQLE